MPKVMIPRLDCLGLIEASFGLGDGRAYCGFRGLIASASLKLGRRKPAVVDLAEIPRLDCLGLIEAVAGSTTGASPAS